MKKTLAFLTFSVLLITAMLFNVCAAFKTDDVGVYIRFDSQEKVDSHIYNLAYIDHIAFDDDMGALRFTVSKNDSVRDYQLGLYLGNAVDLAQYPYMRVTYKWPLKTIKGDNNGARAAFCVFPSVNSNSNSPSGDYNENVDLRKSDDWNRLVLNFTGDCLNADKTVKLAAFSALKYLRIDCPDNATTDDYNDYYIYDIGFFKDSETAYSYNPVQTYAMLDLSDENYATDTFWSGDSSAVEISYDADNKATRFDGSNVKKDGSGEGGDRIISKQLDALDQFNATQYQWLSVKFKRDNTTTSGYFLHGSKDSGIQAAEKSIGVLTDPAKLDADGWQKSSAELSLASANISKHIIKYAMDPMNNEYPDGKYTAAKIFKYLAYYATEAEANLEPQPAPKGITVSAPTANGVKGTISGLTTAMEYRLTGSGDYTAIEADGAIQVDSGRSYDIRYKAKDGYNPGYALTVAVPRYWDFNITQLIYPDGEIVINNAKKIVKTDKQNWTITVPHGIDVTKLAPVYNFTSDAGNTFTDYLGNDKVKRGAVQLYVNGNDFNERASLDAGGKTAFGSAVKIGENQFHIYQPNAIYEVINVTFVEEDASTFALSNVCAYVHDHIVTSNSEGTEKLLTGKAHSIMLAKTDTSFATELQNYANSIASRYVGVTATVEVSEFVAPVAGTIDKKEGTDGSCKLSITVSKDGDTSNTKVVVPVPAAHYHLILNFASPILKNRMNLYGNLTSEFVEDSSSLGGKYLKITKAEDTKNYAEFNFTLYFDGEYMPTIEQLADYPIVVYRDKYSTKGNYQIFYYTNGYTAADAYQSMWPDSVSEFTTHTLKTSFDGLWTGSNKAGHNTTWSNKVGRIRFDFMRSAAGTTQKIAYLDYIGFFATEDDANAFIANPQVDNTQEAINTKYSTQIAAMQAREEAIGTTVTIPTDAVEYDTDGKITDASIRAFVKEQYYVASDGSSILGTDSYIAIDEKNSPVAATAAKAGTDGSFKFQVYLTDSTTNGYVATTKEITVTVAAKKLLSVDTLGATIRKAPATDALRFGIQVNFGAEKLITAVANAEAATYADLNPTTTLTNLKFGALVLPEAALTTAKLTADKLTFANLTATDEANIYKLGEVEVANVNCTNIYEVNADNFVYTAAITGIANQDLKLVAIPYATYSVGAFNLTETVYFKPITRSYNAVKTAVEAESAPTWDAD